MPDEPAATSPEPPTAAAGADAAESPLDATRAVAEPAPKSSAASDRMARYARGIDAEKRLASRPGSRVASAKEKAEALPKDERRRRRAFRTTDFGRARGPQLAQVFLASVVVIVVFRAASLSRYPWPASFSANFLIFLPLVLGFGTFAISLFAPRNSRGPLLVVLGLAPWLYAVNLGAVDLQGVFIDVPPALGGAALFGAWALFCLALIPSLVITRLRTLLPGRAGLRQSAWLPVAAIGLFFGGVAVAPLLDIDAGPNAVVQALGAWFSGTRLLFGTGLVLLALLQALDALLGPDAVRRPPRLVYPEPKPDGKASPAPTSEAATAVESAPATTEPPATAAVPESAAAGPASSHDQAPTRLALADALTSETAPIKMMDAAALAARKIASATDEPSASADETDAADQAPGESTPGESTHGESTHGESAHGESTPEPAAGATASAMPASAGDPTSGAPAATAASEPSQPAVAGAPESPAPDAPPPARRGRPRRVYATPAFAKLARILVQALMLAMAGAWLAAGLRHGQEVVWPAEQHLVRDPRLSQVYTRVITHTVLLFALLFSNLLLIATGLVDTVINHVIFPVRPEGSAGATGSAASRYAPVAAASATAASAAATSPQEPGATSPQEPGV